jgi:aspartyl-tRNA(Asn)/glutamyl-tRNA(Gln) amidotransferase subunit C
MAIERQQVEQLARLARIALDESTLARTTSSLGDVLTLIDQLQAVDTSSVEPMAHPLDAIQRLRLDVVTEPDQRTALQANAPAVQDGLFLVPKVIE